PSGAQHPMTGDDDRQRVGSDGIADGARGTRVTNLNGDVAITLHASVRDACHPSQHAAAEAADQPPVERQVELAEATIEVAVQLAPSLVDPAGRLHDPRGDERGELDQRSVALVLEADPDDPDGGCGH